MKLKKCKTWFGKVRCNAVFAFMQVVTPRIYRDVKENLEYINRVPRPFTLMLHKRFGDKPLVGCEIGFGRGDNAESILNTLNVRKLFCIDPCIGKRYVDWNGVNVFAEGHTAKFEGLKRKSNVKFIELTSDEAVAKIPEKLDFVYVDGLHGFEACLRDLRNYSFLVKKGGFIGGHDFHKDCPEVLRAVFQFSLDNKVAPVVVMPDFWFSR